jgi:hypothetical protein
VNVVSVGFDVTMLLDVLASDGSRALRRHRDRVHGLYAPCERCLGRGWCSPSFVCPACKGEGLDLPAHLREVP